MIASADSGIVSWRLNPVGPRTKPKAAEKPAAPRKAAVAKLVRQSGVDIAADLPLISA